MVQIATVSNHEDADVLVGALHKRGYAVALSQDAAGGQFHVQVGPFASLSEANTMRQKLLDDGYNAVVQP
jgi:cell division septation protein DedD